MQAHSGKSSHYGNDDDTNDECRTPHTLSVILCSFVYCVQYFKNGRSPILLFKHTSTSVSVPSTEILVWIIFHSFTVQSICVLLFSSPQLCLRIRFIFFNFHVCFNFIFTSLLLRAYWILLMLCVFSFSSVVPIVAQVAKCTEKNTNQCLHSVCTKCAIQWTYTYYVLGVANNNWTINHHFNHFNCIHYVCVHILHILFALC